MINFSVIDQLLMTNSNLGKWGYHRQGYCQAGLGAAIDKVRRFFILHHFQLFSAFTNDHGADGLSKLAQFTR